MKTSKTKTLAATLAALFASIGLLPNAMAIPLVWLDGPQLGQSFGGGGITIKAFNYDTGTLYNGIPVGTSIGFSGSPGAGVAVGETTLNNPSVIQRPALNALNAEDSWGIIKITEILAYGSDGVLRPLFNSSSSFELTALFWGVKDFYMTQVAPGGVVASSGQVIDGTGLRVDIYSDFTKNFSQTPGPGQGHVGNVYPTVTDGTLELSLLSTPGFINESGRFGGIATEFESNTASTGYAALNVIGGSAQTVAQFNTNGIGFGGSSGSGFVPGLASQSSTDVWFAFTATQGISGWDITSNDPILANIAPRTVPESGATLALLGCALPLMMLASRRQKRVLAV